MSNHTSVQVVIDAMLLTDKTLRETYSFFYETPIMDSSIAMDKWDDYVRLVKAKGLPIKTITMD